MNPLFHEVFNFLKAHLIPSSRLLLAFSGGPDSTALLYLLKEVQKKCPFELELAHVDHKQRPSSTQEANELNKLACSLGLPFHLKTLQGMWEGNMEDSFRNERLVFFQEMMCSRGCQALVLGHQREDLEETVLKRLFEGASFDRLMGMQPKSQRGEMEIWRPLLNCSKKEILSWLQERNISFIEDKSNCDPSFLRARMRASLIPDIEVGFGKNIRSNLVKYSQESSKLQNFIDQKILPKVVKRSNSWGIYLDFGQKDLHLFEIECILRAHLKEEGWTLSYSQIEYLSQALSKGLGNKKLEWGAQNLVIDRGKLFILKKSLPELPKTPIKLSEGTHFFGPWKVEVKSGEKLKPNRLGLEALFQENQGLFIQIPKGKYFLKVADLKKDKFSFGKSLSRWISTHKTPRFLMDFVPILTSQSELFAEVLTKKTPFVLKGRYLNITLTSKKH